MARRTKITAIVFGTFVFLSISLLLARALTGSGSERAKVLDILQAQARGDVEAVLAEMPRCRRDETCSRVTRARVEELQRPGEVEILSFDPSARATLTDATGSARVAWRTDVETFPVVQCVFVSREGPLSGGGVDVASISNPIELEESCD